MNKYLCIHGHFYQPPRENPWLNEVELQDSAYPYHDWNERITAECYARNSASRILDDEHRIVDIVNNYARISFNFGPTLLEWMAKKSPAVYEAILQADKESQKHFGGHGAALAQAYNHVIMPLANSRDQQTQVIWGIRDFELRFGRMPEGMWCGETAVNTDVLEVMAQHGIKFTILSPYQAKHYRKIGQKEWHNAGNANIDPKRPYLCQLPSGREINLFFYDAPVSQAIAFEKLLDSGEAFADRLLSTYSGASKPELMHIATDGETYGHHHRFGEMALSYALHHIEENKLANLTIYGQYLELFPPTYEAEILENTSWSCAHGVERWNSNCGCHTGGNNGWNQEWRGPLRKAFDWVRDTLIPVYETEMSKYTSEPWEIRNAYIDVIFNQKEENVKVFFNEDFTAGLTKKDKSKILQLLEMQYHAMLMYTSCGWFFDEVTGIESVQDILYASRALQLAQNITGHTYEPEFKTLLAKAKSNIPEKQNAALVYEEQVEPEMLNLLRVGAHYAISSLFTEYPVESKLYCYQASSLNHETHEAGRQRLTVGRAILKSEITWEEEDITYAVFHLGDHQLFGAVRKYQGEEAYDLMKAEIVENFNKSNIHEIIYLLDKHFGAHNYSFWHLFKDDQRNILNVVLTKTLSGVETMFRQLHESNFPVMQALKAVNMNLPNELKNINDFVMNADLSAIFKSADPDLKLLDRIVKNVTRFPVEIDFRTLNFYADKSVTLQMHKLKQNPENLEQMKKVETLIRKIVELKLNPEFWEARNIAFAMHKQWFWHYQEQCSHKNNIAESWCSQFTALFQSLNMKI